MPAAHEPDRGDRQKSLTFRRSCWDSTLPVWTRRPVERSHTGIMPLRPVRKLITTGPYRFSRNPIYLGLLIAYLGVAAMQDQVWPLVTLPLGLWIFRKTVIDVEEAHLAGRFGEEYDDYRRR
jgi:protein-S-isoprenylcysteine O-methyltransferase Ste14